MESYETVNLLPRCDKITRANRIYHFIGSNLLVVYYVIAKLCLHDNLCCIHHQSQDQLPPVLVFRPPLTKQLFEPKPFTNCVGRSGKIGSSKQGPVVRGLLRKCR